MSRGAAVPISVLMLLIVLAAPILAHAPEFPEGSDSLDEAVEIEDPTKSWAIFSHLHVEDQANYYLLRMHQGENITVSLTAPRSSIDDGFLPSVVLMGPGIEDEGALPDFIQVPEGAGTKVVEGDLPPRAEYEPFSPSAFYEIGELSVEAPQDGDYYLAVYGNGIEGNYGLAVGLRESFTVEEWLLIPFSGISIYEWEGQSLATILAPPIGAFLVGLAIMLVLSRGRVLPIDTLWIMATLAGLLMVASTASLVYQMLWSLAQTGVEAAAIVTVMFALISLGIGIAALRIAHKEREVKGVSPRTRAALVAIGIVGLLVWSGYIIGPVIIIAAALLPARLLLHRLGRARPPR